MINTSTAQSVDLASTSLSSHSNRLSKLVSTGSLIDVQHESASAKEKLANLFNVLFGEVINEISLSVAHR